jgi:hypothetical protein
VGIGVFRRVDVGSSVKVSLGVGEKVEEKLAVGGKVEVDDGVKVGVKVPDGVRVEAGMFVFVEEVEGVNVKVFVKVEDGISGRVSVNKGIVVRVAAAGLRSGANCQAINPKQ